MKDMTSQQRLVLLISILASFVAFLDGSVINVALPAIARDLGGGLITQQWVVNAYLITLGSLMLIAGSLSDIFGRKKILVYGLIGFAVTSFLCAVAPNGIILILARAIQGIAGALLVPSSLALIMSTFSGAKQSKAIGSWTAWTVVAPAIGPLIGGILVDVASWRYIFIVTLLPIIVALWLLRSLQAPQEEQGVVKVDFIGAILCALGLGGVVYVFIEQPQLGWSNPLIYTPLIIGLLACIAFIQYERRAVHPMLPLALFKVRNFSVGNIATAGIYAGLSVATFLIAIFIQQIGGYTATEAGIAFLPVTVFMFLLSPLFGSLAGKYGPRWFMAGGPIIAGLGFLVMLRIDHTAAYWTQLFPGIVLFGLGLSMTVAPLTSAILGSISSRQSGIGSAINNAVARVAGLMAIAAVGLVMGPVLTVSGFHQGLIMTALLLIAGGVISAFGIKNPRMPDATKPAPLQ
jgi:EmrB/QacA subfamily drug resistance transporter